MPGLRLSGSEQTLDVRVLSGGAERDEVVFKLRAHTSLARLIDAFHAHRRQPPGTYLLFYNSQEVNPTDSPSSLRMRRADVLHAVPNPALGSYLRVRRTAYPQSYYVTVLDTLLVRAEYLFRLCSTTRMEKLIETYCARIGAPVAQRRFFFDSAAIQPDDTAESLGMTRPGFAYLVISRPHDDLLNER